MGNCLVLQQKVIKVMKTDGKILEYKAPMKVHQVLSDFRNHAISDELPAVQYLLPDEDMLGGHLYYLLPQPNLDKKMVKFSKPAVEVGQETGVVRIKVVISKQELLAMLSKGGLSINHVASQNQKDNHENGLHGFESECSGKVWRPVLESIPEAD